MYSSSSLFGVGYGGQKPGCWPKFTYVIQFSGISTCSSLMFEELVEPKPEGLQKNWQFEPFDYPIIRMFD